MSETSYAMKADRIVKIGCEKEMGTWTVRVNGCFVWDSWREASARRLAMRLFEALEWSPIRKDSA